MIEPSLCSVVPNDPYERSDLRFHQMDVEDYTIPSLPEAQSFLSKLNISFSQCDESHIRRGALVLSRT